MIYSMHIGVSPRADVAEAHHRPIIAHTLNTSRPEITDEEIDLVAEFFKQQVKSAIVFMIRGVNCERKG